MHKIEVLNIDEFIIQKKIHENDIGALFVARNKKTHKLVMVKTLAQDVLSHILGEDNFIHKIINIISKITHPIFPKFIGYSSFDFSHLPNPAIITEFCGNTTLKSVIDSEKLSSADFTWDKTKKLKIIYGIAHAMSFLHSHGIILRNLSPEYIILDDEYNPKIVDFSLIEYYDLKKKKITCYPIYSAPEFILDGKYSPKSDVFSFAMIVYELLFNKMPYEICPNIEKYITTGQRPSLDDKTIDNLYIQLIEECWSQNPDKRPSFSQIIQKLKEETGFISSGIFKGEFFDYVEEIDQSDINFEILVSEENINRPITKDLIKQFKDNPQKIKYYIITLALQEISSIMIHYKYNQNLDVTIDLKSLNNLISKKIMNIVKQLGKIDLKMEMIHDDIINIINEEYIKIYKKIKEESFCASSLVVLNEIIQIFEDKMVNNEIENENIQMKINKVLDQHPEEVLFNKDKLKNIDFKSAEISEMLSSLRAIVKNPQLQNFVSNEPRMSVVFSSDPFKMSYEKSLANILFGNCFFITLYGYSSCTRKVLSSILFNSLLKHEINDIITIYGPVDLISFGKNIEMPHDLLKKICCNTPNLYFIEINDRYDDSMMDQWCKFISFISHYLIFCSESDETKDYENFKKSLLLSFFDGKLINCSPYPNLTITSGSSKKVIKSSINIEINSLKDNLLLNFLFKDIYVNRLDFITCETVASLSVFIYKTDMSKIFQNYKKDDFKYEIMDNYSTRMHDKAIETFHVLIKKTVDSIYSKIKIGEYINDFHLDQTLEYFIDKTQEYLFTNIDQQFWNNKEFSKISTVLIVEVKNDFEAATLQIKRIESIGKLLSLLNPENIKKDKYRIKILFNDINSFNSSINANMFPKSQQELLALRVKLEKLYDEFAQSINENHQLIKTVQSFSDQLYTFLNQNPIASDIEYSKHYDKLYKLNISTTNPAIYKYINVTLNIRNVLKEYHPKKFTIEIDKRSFDHGGIKLNIHSMELVLNSSFTSHDLYKLINEKFNLQNIPFHMTRITNNQYNNPIEVIILDDYTNLSLFNSYNFTVYYGKQYYSTQVLIESLIPKKIIKIADDFIIKTNSNNAEYNVTFPQDHKGWFGVDFDIKEISGENDETDYTLIYLTLTAKEITFLQDSHLLFHQSKQNEKWVNEEDDVFASFPDCKTVVFPLRHCSKHRLLPILLYFYRNNKTDLEKNQKSEKEDLMDLQKFLNPKYSRDWENDKKKCDRKFIRGGEIYYLPIGYVSEGILVEKFIENTCVGFHATRSTTLFKIITEGFKLPSELGGVRRNHFKLNVEKFKIKNFADAIFVSPSVQYASHYGKHKILAQQNDMMYVLTGHIKQNNILIIILQVRVTPKSYKVIPNTTRYDIVDPHYDNDHIEWRIKNTNDVFPYRILMKSMSGKDYSDQFKLHIRSNDYFMKDLNK